MREIRLLFPLFSDEFWTNYVVAMLMLPSAEVLDGAVPQLLERHAARVGAAKGSGAGGSSGRLPGERLGAKRSGGNMSRTLRACSSTSMVGNSSDATTPIRATTAMVLAASEAINAMVTCAQLST